jgi:cholesterol transport system auxiliary component
MYKFIFIAILVLLSGCSRIKPAVTQFTINTNVQNSDLTASRCLDKSLKVSQAFSPNALMSLKMNYDEGNNKRYAYSESEWADTPNRLVTSEIIKLLRETKFFKSVQPAQSRSKSTLILETNIEDFMQYFINDSTESYSSVVLSLTLLDSTTNEIVATKTFSVKVKTKTLDAKGGVEALNAALGDNLTQVQDWLFGVCK